MMPGVDNDILYLPSQVIGSNLALFRIKQLITMTQRHLDWPVNFLASQGAAVKDGTNLKNLTPTFLSLRNDF